MSSEPAAPDQSPPSTSGGAPATAVAPLSQLPEKRKRPDLDPDCPADPETHPLVSVIIPCYNGEQYLDECLESIVQQTYAGRIEISIYNDCSNDGTADIISQWGQRLKEHPSIALVCTSGAVEGGPMYIGFARNRAVEASKGEILAFLDADDIMLPKRLEVQVPHMLEHPNHIVGGNFIRIPINATARHSDWLNNLTNDELMTARFRELTLMPSTWVMGREAYSRTGGFNEGHRGTPEDLMFYYKHVELGGGLSKVDEVVTLYRYHAQSVSFNVEGAARSFGVPREVIFSERLRHLELTVLDHWERFSIWGVGKLGKQLYAALSDKNRKKVVEFGDIDAKKIGTKYHHAKLHESVPIVHFRDMQRPFVTAVNLGLTEGEFEKNLASLNLTPGVDYYHFW